MKNNPVSYYQKNTKEERPFYPFVQKATTISGTYLDGLFSQTEKTETDRQPLTVIVEKRSETLGTETKNTIQIFLQFCVELTKEPFAQKDGSPRKLFPTIKFVLSLETKHCTCFLTGKEELETLKNQINCVPVGYLRKTRGHISYVEGDDNTNLLERELFLLNFSDYYKTMEPL